jgi:hypothetical protein
MAKYVLEYVLAYVKVKGEELETKSKIKCIMDLYMTSMILRRVNSLKLI